MGRKSVGLLSGSKMDTDMMVRIKAFDWLSDQVDIHGDVPDRKLLEEALESQGQRATLIAPQRILEPRIMTSPFDHDVPHSGYSTLKREKNIELQFIPRSI